MKKKMLAMLLALAMVLTSVPSTVYATGDSGTDDSAVTTEVDGQTDDADADNQSEEDVDQDADDADDTIVDTEEKENTPAATSEEGEEATEQGEDAWYNAEETEFVISSVEDLFAFAEAVNEGNNFSEKIVKLGANIDLAGKEWTPIGGDFVYFAGEFDGQGYTISNLTQTTGARMGLFGLVEKAYIHNLTLKDVSFTVTNNEARVGALAGNLQYWNVIEDVTIDGIQVIVNGKDGLIGSVAGYVWKSQLDNVDVKNAEYTVTGTDNVIGGHTAYGRAHVWDTNVTGNNAHWLDGTVQTIDGTEYVLQNYFVDCDVDGIKMTLNGTGTEAGGFFGSDTYNSHSNYFVDSHVKGLDVTCAEGTSQIVGGFIAWNNGTTSAGTVKGFEGCSATGTIKGADGIYGGFVAQVGGRACSYVGASADVDITCTGTAGGFVGATQAYSTHKYTFENCEAKGNVTAKVAGGFAGKNGMSGDGKSVFVEYSGCVASGKVKGTSVAGGFLGEVNTELPATNWNTVDSEGCLTLIENTGSKNVTGNGYTSTLIGYIDGVANFDAKEGNKLKVNLIGNEPEDAYNLSEDTSEEDIITSGVAKIDGVYYESLKAAVEAANAIEGGATVTLLKDVTLGEKLTISGNVTISGAHTITRDDAYTGTLFAVNEGAALTLDGGLVVDGANEYVFDKEAYNADALDWNTSIAKEDSAKWFTPEEGAPVANAFMITTTGGTVNLNKVTIQNSYSVGSGIVSAGGSSTINLTGAKITHVAATQGNGVVANVSGANVKVNVNEGTVIDGNHVGGNHGLFKIYTGATLTMNGGEITNNTGWNSNGTVVGVYGGTFYMKGGKICSNTGVYGPSNGRNAAIYLHSGHTFEMTGGTICCNSGRARGGIDAPYDNGTAMISGGEVLDNISRGGWDTPDVNGTSAMEISGGTFTQDVSKYLAPNTGLVYDEENKIYTVTDHVYNLWFRDPATGEQVPGVGPLQGNNLAELIETGKLFYADYYDMELEVLSNVKVDETAVIDYPMTINLNGHTITGVAKEGVQVYPVIRVQGGADVIVKGEGGITNADYVFVVGASDGTSTGNLTIESGKYKGQTTVASVTKGTLTIKGGEFSINEEAETYDYAYVLNCVDANYKDDSAKIEVTGGTFHKFNPAENAAEGTGTNFVPEKYESTYDEEADTYTVAEMDYVKWVQEQLYAGNDVKLEKDIVITDYELVHAHAFPSNGNGKYNEVHGNGAIFHVIEPGVELDLNGHSITWDAHDDDYCNKRQVSLFMVTIEGNAGDESSLTIKDSGGTGRVDVYGMGTGMYVVGVDAKATIEGGTWTNYPCNTCQASNIFMYPSHGGEMYITDGTFEQKDSEYLLGWKGSSEKTTNNGVGVDYDETKVEITGGTFVGFNPEEVKFFDTANSGQETINGLAEGYAANESESDGTTEYKVVNAVVEMDGKYYETIKDALFTLKSADTTVHKVKVLQDHEIDVNYSTYNYPILVNGFAIELDLNGKTITADWSKYTGSRKDNALIGVCNGGKLTVIDSSEEKLGKIINNDSKEDVENRIFWIMTSTATKSIEVNIEGGNFYQNDVNTALLYVQGNKPSDNLAPIYVNIKGGYFETVDDDFFNAYDGYQHESYITGGTFNKNPEDHEIKIHPDYQAVENEDGTYSVVEKIVAKIGETGYTTLADALANAKSGETVYMVADHEDKSAATIIPAGVTLDLKGKVVEAKNVLAFGTVIDTADVVGGIKISNDTTEAIVHLQPENGGYLPIYDTTYTDNNATGCYRFFDYRLLSGKDTGVDENTGKSYAKLIVKFKFTNNQAYEVLARTSITGLDLLADIIWTNASTTIAYKFKPETIKEYAQTECDVLTGKRTDIKNPVLTLKLFGIEKLNSGDIISMTPSVSTYSSVVVTGRKNDVTIE